MQFQDVPPFFPLKLLYSLKPFPSVGSGISGFCSFLLTFCALLELSSAQNTTTKLPQVYNVLVQVNEPFICTEDAPCWRFASKQITRNGCPRNGIKVVNGGKCVHGYSADLLNLIADEYNLTFRVTLLSSNVGTNDLGLELSRPGSVHSISIDYPGGLCTGANCDLAAVDLTITGDRRTALGVKYSVPIRDNALRLYMRYQEPSEFQAGLWPFMPFSPTLWVAWILLQLFAGIILTILNSKEHRRYIYGLFTTQEQRKGEIQVQTRSEQEAELAKEILSFHDIAQEEKHDLAYQLYYLGSFSGLFQGNAGSFKYWSSRLFAMAYFFWQVLFVSNYTASVTAALGQAQNWALMEGVSLSKSDAWQNLLDAVPKGPPGSLIIRKGTVSETFATQDLQVNFDNSE